MSDIWTVNHARREKDSMQQSNDPESSPQPYRQRRAGPVLYLKLVLIPAGLLVLVYALAHSDASWGAVQNPLAVVGGAGLFLIAATLAGLRMALTLRASGGHIAPGRAIEIHFRSMFYHLFVPFGVGLDGAKFVMLNAIWARGKMTLAMILVLDRAIGVVGFALLSVVLGMVLI